MSQKAVETKKEITFTKAFSTFSVGDLQKAKNFYEQTLGLMSPKQGKDSACNSTTV